MEVLDAIETRRSVRKFKTEEIPEEDLMKILEAGRLAPSAGNRQPWRFVVVRDAGTVKQKERIRTRVAHGEIVSIVERTE